MELKNKTAIITGGGRGIGKAIALELAKEGCNVVVTSRSEKELGETVKEVESVGGKALGLPLDLAIEENLEQIVDRTMSEFGTIDILINNAGIFIPRPFMEVTTDELDDTLCVNLRSAFILSQKVLHLMKEQGNGYIINVSSTVALGVPANLSTYGISKCGMVGLSQALYESAKQYGIKVSTVYPGITDTKMVRDANDSKNSGKWMLPEDIAYCMMFLLKASDRMVVKDIVPESFKLGVK